MKKTELRFTKFGIVLPVHEDDMEHMNDVPNSAYIDRVWEGYHKMKEQLEAETNMRKQLETYIDETLKPHIHELHTELERYKKAVAELQKVTDAVKIWADSSAYAKAGQLMGALHEYEANNDGTH